VMPQTKEAISHAKAAGVPVLVAINKIDKPEADPERVKQQLSKEGLLIEEWGGDTICVEISAKEGKNINELLDMILLLSEVMEIKSNPRVKAQGVVLEAKLDPRKGPIGTVIIQLGTLTGGEPFVSGYCSGKVKAVFDEKGKPLKKVEPSMPAEVLGFCKVPSAGDFFQAVSNPDEADRIIKYRKSKIHKEEPEKPDRLTLDQLFKQMEEKEKKELSLVVKADVQGSVDTLTDILPNLGSNEINIKIVHAATGQITESDVILASSSNAIIIGYNTKYSSKIEELAKEEQVEIRLYKVIYQLIDDIKKALTGLFEPEEKEVYLGRADVRKIFTISRVGVIAGCLVTDGKISRNARARVIRNGKVIYTGRISSLKHLKENVTEAKKEYECGIGLDKFKDIQEGDIIEAFSIEKAT
ncbi:MAG: translation initiation factor IF-2, partial [Acidobacteriota bacterium]